MATWKLVSRLRAASTLPRVDWRGVRVGSNTIACAVRGRAAREPQFALGGPRKRDVRACSTDTVASSSDLSGKGAVVGCYEVEGGEGWELSEAGKALNERTTGQLLHKMRRSGGKLKIGDSRLFYDLSEELGHVAVVGVGSAKPSQDHLEDIDVGRENVRTAAAAGIRALRKANVKEILLDDFEDPEACAEGGVLSLFMFDKLKGDKKRKKVPEVQLLSGNTAKREAWHSGWVRGEAQNMARELMETPSNLMTPSIFVEAVSKHFGGLDVPNGRVEIIPRPRSWIKEKEMGAFLSIAQGSEEEPWFLEMKYHCADNGTKPLVLVGKGVTFDTGGISIKPSASMGLMKGDMGGAACVAAATMAAAQLGLPVSLVTLIPLCENMPSGRAVKPGDVVKAMNGKSIEVDNTDAEGRLLLADALCYAHSFSPSAIVNVATLTGAIDVALGSGAAGVFSNSQLLWQQLHMASQSTGDRLWRMPLYEQYSKQIESQIADVSNVGKKGRSAGSCTAAAFLKEFVSVPNWAHIDIAGVMENTGEVPFLEKGMAGRPTRTLIKFLEDYTMLD